MKKPKVAFFDFACCEGCQLQVANFGEDLLTVLSLVDLVEFREVMSEKWNKAYDIAIIEGSITTSHAVERVKEIRKRAKTVIAFGSCATIGGVNGMKNNFVLSDVKSYVYKDKADYFETIETKPLHQVIDVDYFVHGCPIYPAEFIEVLKCALAGIPYNSPEYAVCVDCKFNENICMYDKGTSCLGPITRAGCNSWCINNGNICYGCRGIVKSPNLEGFKEVLKISNVDQNLIETITDIYNSVTEDKDE